MQKNLARLFARFFVGMLGMSIPKKAAPAIDAASIVCFPSCYRTFNGSSNWETIACILFGLFHWTCHSYNDTVAALEYLGSHILDVLCCYAIDAILIAVHVVLVLCYLAYNS